MEQNTKSRPCQKELETLYSVCFNEWKNCELLYESYEKCMLHRMNKYQRQKEVNDISSSDK